MDEAAISLGHRLRNVLKHQKAHRWVCCEYFYANIDRSLLWRGSDFCNCLKVDFPTLKTKQLTRAEWGQIRRLTGRPRRFSPAFLSEERASLGNKRKKIRQLQQQKFVDVSYYRDLPEQIPLSLVIGTRVTALLHQPHYGLFDGVIDAVDTKSHGYRITFQRNGVGTHTVPDFEVLSIDPPEFLPLSSFQARIKPRRPILKSPKFLEILSKQISEALGGKADSLNAQTFATDSDDSVGSSQYPIKLLALLVRVLKLLSFKRKRIHELKSANDQVERLHSIDERVPDELRRSYAGSILELDKLNSDLEDHLKAIQIFSSELSIDTSCLLDPDQIRQKCSNEAKDLVEEALPDYGVSNETSISLITHLMTLMYHLKSLSENNDSAVHLKALNDSMHEYKSKLPIDEIPSYEDNVEIHVNLLAVSDKFSGTFR